MDFLLIAITTFLVVSYLSAPRGPRLCFEAALATGKGAALPFACPGHSPGTLPKEASLQGLVLVFLVGFYCRIFLIGLLFNEYFGEQFILFLVIGLVVFYIQE